LVISTCVLEHIKNWRDAVSNMKQVCKPNGIILIIVPSVWPFHGYPHDYWRYSKIDIENIFSDCHILLIKEDQRQPTLVYAKIRKPENYSENDLTNYPLFSIISQKKALEINEKQYQKFIKKCTYFRNIRQILTNIKKYLM
jgi:2-polyprenyl-3-methyl-5-hydroxy-6-metoxy-1,4-benzoquinol methylase